MHGRAFLVYAVCLSNRCTYYTERACYAGSLYNTHVRLFLQNVCATANTHVRASLCGAFTPFCSYNQRRCISLAIPILRSICGVQ